MTLNPTNLSRPEAYYEKLLRKRYSAAVRKRGLCAFCSCRDRTLGIVHCQGNESRQMGMCQDDGRLPQFRLDDETLEEFRHAA
ncbi:hypothetical protein AB8813_09020 [Xanthomonas arboricola pv. corylina]|uniref:hypothetical protein n=1 Tax=Xanthomonas arboricola TaxID=56448 RepID=UPI000CEEE4D1|nr:hypothetical protein [Xanthomonas arboricola]PPU60025.1 hypothetical protein XacyCFBP1159_13270 [Xanthomonas arboricola pv. corylina]